MIKKIENCMYEQMNEEDGSFCGSNIADHILQEFEHLLKIWFMVLVGV